MDIIAFVQKALFWIIGIGIFFGIIYSFFRPRQRREDEEEDKNG